MPRSFRDLSEAEILALAITLEEEDERVYADLADGLRASYPSSAAVFDAMRAEESQHRAGLIDLFTQRFVRIRLRIKSLRSQVFVDLVLLVHRSP